MPFYPSVAQAPRDLTSEPLTPTMLDGAVVPYSTRNRKRADKKNPTRTFNMDSDDEDEDDSGPIPSGGGCLSSLAWLRPSDDIQVPQTILKDINGVIEPGSMVAIMGASGAGKTTLLSALSGRTRLHDNSMYQYDFVNSRRKSNKS